METVPDNFPSLLISSQDFVVDVPLDQGRRGQKPRQVSDVFTSSPIPSVERTSRRPPAHHLGLLLSYVHTRGFMKSRYITGSEA